MVITQCQRDKFLWNDLPENNLWGVGVVSEIEKLITIPLKNTSQPATTVKISHVAALDQMVFGTGTDGNIYRVNYPDTAFDTFR